MNAGDERLLDILQADFPIAADPYAVLARTLGMDPEALFARVTGLRQSGLIRRIGPIYDREALGLASTLCAVHCPGDAVEHAAQVLGRCDGVTHAYLRAGAGADRPPFGENGVRPQREDIKGTDPIFVGTDRNLWFTLTAANPAALDEALAQIAERLALGPILTLVTRRTFKVRAVFAMGNSENQERATQVSPPVPGAPRGRTLLASDLTRRVIAATQGGLSAGRDPYGDAATTLGVSRDDLVSTLRALRRAGVIRRTGGILDQRRLGLAGNCLTAWRVPAERVEEVGLALAAQPAVSHCYERATPPDWPYNVYAMLHAPDEAACERLAAELAGQLGVPEPLMLFTRRELKKRPPRYL
jgi:DNA-binding Lrp family transcriptional regulator